MNWNDAYLAVKAARETMRNSDVLIREAADLLRGRLRAAAVDQHTLRMLKAELRLYNPHTGKWRDPK